MGEDFKCGCRVSGAWYLCKKHESKLIEMITEFEFNKKFYRNTISDVIRDSKGNIKKFVNERPMEKAK